MTTSSMCGIVLDDGRDCPNYVDPTAPINLCGPHFEQAFDWYRLNVYNPPIELVECELCGEVAGQPADSGYRCGHCGHKSADFAGARPENHDRPIASRQVIVEPKLELVYYLGFGDRIKIGTTTNLHGRIAQIPHDDVLAIEVGGYRLEHQRHAEFSEHRLTGEWFAAAPGLLEHIERLKHPGGWAKHLRELQGLNW